MGWELASERIYPTLTLLPEPTPLAVVELRIHEVIWEITQPTDFEKMLQKPKYQAILLEFYAKNGNPQSVENKIQLLESHGWTCRIPGSREQILKYLEFGYLCDIDVLDRDDYDAYCL